MDHALMFLSDMYPRPTRHPLQHPQQCYMPEKPPVVEHMSLFSWALRAILVYLVVRDILIPYVYANVHRWIRTLLGLTPPPITVTEAAVNAAASFASDTVEKVIDGAVDLAEDVVEAGSDLLEAAVKSDATTESVPLPPPVSTPEVAVVAPPPMYATNKRSRSFSTIVEKTLHLS